MQMHMCYIGEGKNKTDYLVAGSKEGPYAASFKRYRVKPMSKPERQRAILSIGWLRDCLEAQEVKRLMAVAATCAFTSLTLWHGGDARLLCTHKGGAALGGLAALVAISLSANVA